MSIYPYGRQSIDDDDVAAVVAVLKSDFLTQGPLVSGLEQSLSGHCGGSHMVAVSNGTAALHIACLAADLGPGDAAIVPSITFAATSNAVLYCGATPIFVDISLEDYGLDCTQLEEAAALAKKLGKKLKAILPVHYAGRTVDMRGVREFADAHKLIVIEDACHALGAEYRLEAGAAWTRVGSGHYSDMTAFSFHPVKHIATGEGGAVATRDPALAKRLEKLRSHGITKVEAEYEHEDRAKDPKTGGSNPWYHEMQDLGLNYRLSDILAALGVSQLKKLDKFVARRREIAAMYDKAFSDLPHVLTPPGDSSFAKHSYHLYPLAIDFDALAASRAEIMNHLKALDVGSQVHYLPVFYHPYYQRHKTLWSRVSTNKAEQFYRRQLSIPMFPALADADVERVAERIRKVLRP